MLHDNVRHIAVEAERVAAEGEVVPTLNVLRRLCLDDFGLVLMSMPHADFPHLSKVLPRMTDADIQTKWTGASGFALLTQTTVIARILDSLSWRLTGRGLRDKQILDFGCGYGRIIRMMYYYTDPANITGADAWQRSLDHGTRDGLLGTFIKTDPVPDEIGTAPHDICYAYSVFTHLSPEASSASLAALREVTRELLLLTIRPVEYWNFHAQSDAVPVQELIAAHHKSLFAFHEHQGREHYGDTSIHLDYFRQLPTWELVAYERSLTDPFQTMVALRPA